MKQAIMSIKRNIKENLRQIKSWMIKDYNSIDMKYDDYLDIQHRCDPLEFVGGRHKIVSSFVFILEKLDEENILKEDKIIDSANFDKVVGYKNSFLDVGTRDGYVVEFMNSLGFYNAKGVEVFKDYIKYAQSKGRKVEFGDIHDLPYKDSTFDIVYCRHTLEHTLYPQKALQELYRVVKTKGVLYVSLPMEMQPHGKHTVSIPNKKVFKKFVISLNPAPTILYMGLSSKVGIIPDGNEVCALIVKN